LITTCGRKNVQSESEAREKHEKKVGNRNLGKENLWEGHLFYRVEKNREKNCGKTEVRTNVGYGLFFFLEKEIR
jgi:hypothetical protein